MLAACAEAEPGEEALVALGRLSQSLWPAFAAELEAATGLAVDLRREGTLVVALNADDQARLRHHLAFQKRLGAAARPGSRPPRRGGASRISAGLAGAVFSPRGPSGRQSQARGGAARRGRAGRRRHPRARRGRRGIDDRAGRAAGVRARGRIGRRGGRRGDRRRRMVARDRRRSALRPPVRPMKGQMLALQMDPAAPLLSHVVWAPNVYMVPRRDGRLIVGATVEEKGFDTTLTAGGVLALLEAAWRVLPAIEELPIDEMWVGHRPGSRDDAPILGPAAIDGLVYATGHHRNGILLTPVTADAIARLVLDGELDAAIRPFGIERFAHRAGGRVATDRD